MPILTVIAIVVFTGYAIYSRVTVPPNDSTKTQVEAVLSMDDEQTEPLSDSSPSPATSPDTTSPSPTSKSTSTQDSSKIDIKVDSTIDDTTPSAEKIVYPGAVSVGSHYETDANPDTVYDWYKNELEKRTFQIRNNVKTRANDKFKAILQGVSGSSSIKVTIEQENAGSKTIISFE